MSARDPMGFDKPPFSLPPEVAHHEPDSWWEAWPWLLCGVVVVSLLVWASAWGYV